MAAVSTPTGLRQWATLGHNPGGVVVLPHLISVDPEQPKSSYPAENSEDEDEDEGDLTIGFRQKACWRCGNEEHTHAMAGFR